jgi:ATP-dependent RNA helicase DDX24/MAK5
MSKDLQRDLKKKRRARGGTAIQELLSRLDFRDENPLIINIDSQKTQNPSDLGEKSVTTPTLNMPNTSLPATLQQTKLECLTKEKDLFLYYFLLRYPGRSLIFCGSIDGIRRLDSVLTILGFKVGKLHGEMKMKDRLKALDR